MQKFLKGVKNLSLVSDTLVQAVFTEIGLADRNDFIAFIENKIETEVAVPYEFLEISLNSRKCLADLLSVLFENSNFTELKKEQEQQIKSEIFKVLYSGIVSGRYTAADALSFLYRWAVDRYSAIYTVVYLQRFLTDEDKKTIDRLSDSLYLAENDIYGSVEETAAEITQYIKEQTEQYGIY